MLRVLTRVPVTKVSIQQCLMSSTTAHYPAARAFQQSIAPRFREAVILAPMVRFGTLPSRLTCLAYGADIVYTQETIDHKLIKCRRVINSEEKTIDFVLPSNEIVLRTCERERGRVILQIGTSSPERAVQVARLCGDDFAGIDVNMGCPKEFSLKGGMGAALLRTPDLAASILEALMAEVGDRISVTCKIRVLDTPESTVALAKRLIATGIAAIGVHSRRQAERPREAGHPDLVRAVVDASPIPVIANGGSLTIKTYADAIAFRDLTGAPSVMIARAAQYNMSVFRKEGLVSELEAAIVFVREAVALNHPVENVRWVLQILFAGASCVTMAMRTQVGESRTLEDICRALHQRALADEAAQRRKKGRGHERPGAATDEGTGQARAKRVRLDVDHAEHVVYARKRPGVGTSKAVLADWCVKNRRALPSYEVVEEADARSFRAVCVMFDGKRYSSLAGERNKRFSEQTAAAVCLRARLPEISSSNGARMLDEHGNDF